MLELKWSLVDQQQINQKTVFSLQAVCLFSFLYINLDFCS